ncbi:Serpentine Receptor, class T [Caenorhabditis elegans]|uniref:Serpentine Receptor, class T n=1 Tax=Caenorhabditis elegans TaxID=6239 RepID=O76434_CAEEL|nr:Serpentine Receptor, class T [Caenorhabditis elegans]CCD65465.1 Serpentine Receptor, class T [Caenorhabditis elegans]|eukprot:NP_503738.1 Serpentine Receptor, class T [Caenorhabditis elegans]
MNNIIKYGSVEAIPLYNCSAHTPEEWSELNGYKRPIAGIIDMTYGILMNIVYIPILAVMLEEEHFKMSCFKVMTFLGIVDMLALWVNSIITGFLAYQGAVYCSYPNLIYISGMAGFGLWCCSCIIAMSLVINRILDLSKESLCKLIFDGAKTYGVLTLPVIYGMYFVIFTTPIAFSSKHLTWFFNPLIFPNMTHEYTNLPHGFNNLFVVAFTCLMYASFCCVVLEKVQEIEGPTKNNALSKQIFFQSALICAVNQTASVIYVIMNFIEVPLWLIMLGHMLWQTGHGAPVFIYLGLNRTIRNGVLRRLGVKTSVPVSPTV